MVLPSENLSLRKFVIANIAYNSYHINHLLTLCHVLYRSEAEKYQKRANALVSETFYFSIMFFSAIWLVAPNPFTPVSYLLGALLGTAYCYGLGKYVQTLGGSAYDAEDVKGSGTLGIKFLIDS